MNEEDRLKNINAVTEIFIERNRNTIAEKISDLMTAGHAEDDACHIIIQTVKNLPRYLLPLKVATIQEEAHIGELILSGGTVIQNKFSIEPEPEDDSVLDRYFFH